MWRFNENVMINVVLRNYRAIYNNAMLLLSAHLHWNLGMHGALAIRPRQIAVTSTGIEPAIIV